MGGVLPQSPSKRWESGGYRQQAKPQEALRAARRADACVACGCVLQVSAPVAQGLLLCRLHVPLEQLWRRE